MQSCIRLTMQLPRIDCGPLFRALNTAKSALPYLNRITAATRHGLNASLKLNHHVTAFIRNNEKKVTKAISSLKFLSILNLVSHLSTLPDIFQRAVQEMTRGNRLEASLATLGCVVNIGEIVDNASTFINASLTLASGAPIEFLTKLAFPLSIGLVMFNTAVKVLTITKTKNLFKQFSEINLDRTQFVDQGQNQLENFLRSFGITEFTMDSLQGNKNLLLKSLPKKIAVELSEIITILSGEAPNTDRLIIHLNKMTALFNKNLNVEWGHLISNILGAIGLALFAMPVAPFLPFAFLFLREMFRLSVQLYNDC